MNTELEKAMQDKTGLIKYSLEKGHKEFIYKGIAKLMELLENNDKGVTYASLRRTYAEAKAHFTNFERQLGMEIPASKKK